MTKGDFFSNRSRTKTKKYRNRTEKYRIHVQSSSFTSHHVPKTIKISSGLEGGDKGLYGFCKV